ncbi:hypothetical protein PQQ53_21400 [Paraburkholderia strydomiana]|uniref:hypothetical protein n=1 Tax=Paraburkholderia strydomiana TaxID=1245417 RepID=UPI0038B88B7B
MTKKTNSPLVTREPVKVRATIEQIARDAGTSTKTVERCIAKAERSGWLAVSKMIGKEREFSLMIPEGFAHD